MRLRPAAWILAGAFLLTGLGLWWLPGASPQISLHYFGDAAHFTERHRLWTAVGLFGFAAIVVPLENLMRRVMPWTVLPALLGVLLTRSQLIGWTAGGSARWIRLGSLTVAPMDFLAPALVGLTGWMAWKVQHRRSRVRRLVKYLSAISFALAALLAVLEPDLSHAFVIITVGASTIWTLGVSRRSLFISILIGTMLVLAVGLWGPADRFGYVQARFKAFYTPELAPESVRPDIMALRATWSSFLERPWGRGSGQGVGFRQLSAPHNDYLLAVALEQHGWLAGVLLILGYLFLTIGGLMILQRTRDPFLRPVVAGCVALLVMPALLQIAVTLGLVPVVSAPMPLVTYGGTSMITAWVEVGALIRASRLVVGKRSRRLDIVSGL